MTPYLFVYGTLMHAAAHAGMGGPQRQRLHAESRLIGTATLPGTLYDFGAHPAATDPAPGSGDLLHGEILELPNAAATFLWLDPYEDIRPGHTDNRYVRVERTATLDDGRALTVWVYLYVADLARAQRVAGGRWHASR
jgi:gamma-glutamylcyclotransferase (GGCT)/AIG2-like uncharacterized protein YtfP